MTKEKYLEVRKQLLTYPEIIISIENYTINSLFDLILKYQDKIENDYNSASNLLPFWKNYPPDDRGRKPRGDQIPWIEVGEHALGDNLISHIHELGEVNFPGIPAGPDIRFTVSNEKIRTISNNLIDGCWSMIDIKSVGPRDNFDHAVMSHNQVSGSGNWNSALNGIVNDVMNAQGIRTSHEFHASLPPLYIMPNGEVMLTTTLFIKPIYHMSKTKSFSQLLDKIKIGCIPNGLLLSGDDGYLIKHPGLLFPGKDDKSQNKKKLRARVDFNILSELDAWRIQNISF